MANIYLSPFPQPHHLDFSRNGTHSPSSLGFGFGLSSSQQSSSPLSPYNHHQVPRPHKRRLENDEESNSRSDDAMDRSPTPERPKRGPPKRLRVVNSDDSAKGNVKDSDDYKTNKAANSDADVGVLLASLPQQSLLPLLLSLLQQQPSLKPILLSLIPRPTLVVALQVLMDASKTLRDAYPYSIPRSRANSEFEQQQDSNSFSREVWQSLAVERSSAMRESYILSRLRPHISEFMATCFSYLPYFSFLPSSVSTNLSTSGSKPHPTETFTFLSTLMTHILSQPQVTQIELLAQLTPRLLQEWKAWLDRIDTTVNREGGMFSAEIAQSWDRSLHDLAEKHVGMKEIRHSWIDKVGWLVGKRHVVNMEEDEEL